MYCKICKNVTKILFQHDLINIKNVQYYHCPECDFIQTDEPYWLELAYRNSINYSDTGYLSRNIRNSKMLLLIIILFFKKSADFLDFGAGYGVLVRLMRDYGLNFYWTDAYTKNIFAKGFEYQEQKVELATCFECFEHFVDPIKEFDKIFSKTQNLLFTTELFSKNNAPSAKEWDYYGFSHGQHIAFYSIKTLRYIAKKFNKQITSFKDIHLLTSKEIPHWIYKTAIMLSRLPVDLFTKRLLKSKTKSDSVFIINHNDNI